MSRVPPFHSTVTSSFPRESRSRSAFADDTPPIERWARRYLWVVLALTALAVVAVALAFVAGGKCS